MASGGIKDLQRSSEKAMRDAVRASRAREIEDHIRLMPGYVEPESAWEKFNRVWNRVGETARYLRPIEPNLTTGQQPTALPYQPPPAPVPVDVYQQDDPYVAPPVNPLQDAIDAAQADREGGVAGYLRRRTDESPESVGGIEGAKKIYSMVEPPLSSAMTTATDLVTGSAQRLAEEYKKNFMPEVQYIDGIPYTRDPATGKLVQYTGIETEGITFPDLPSAKDALASVMPEVSGKDIGKFLKVAEELYKKGKETVETVKKDYPPLNDPSRITLDEAKKWVMHQFTGGTDVAEPAKPEPKKEAPTTEAPTTLQPGYDSFGPTGGAAGGGGGGGSAGFASDLEQSLQIIDALYGNQNYVNPAQERADAEAERQQGRTAMLAQLALAGGMLKGAGGQWEGLGEGFLNAASVYDKGFMRYQNALQNSADRFSRDTQRNQAFDISKKNAAVDLATSMATERRAWAKEGRDRISKYFEKEIEAKTADGTIGEPGILDEIFRRWRASEIQGEPIPPGQMNIDVAEQ